MPDDPGLRETAKAIARSRELVEKARRLGAEADRQIEGVQATLEQADRVLDRSHQLLSGNDKPGETP